MLHAISSVTVIFLFRVEFQFLWLVKGGLDFLLHNLVIFCSAIRAIISLAYHSESLAKAILKKLIVMKQSENAEFVLSKSKRRLIGLIVRLIYVSFSLVIILSCSWRHGVELFLSRNRQATLTENKAGNSLVSCVWYRLWLIQLNKPLQ